MNILKLIPKPDEMIKKTHTAFFDKSAGDTGRHPWLQQTARNLGHAAFGDTIGNAVDTKFLGDVQQGSPSFFYNGNQSILQQPMVGQQHMMSTQQPQPMNMWLKLLATK